MINIYFPSGSYVNEKKYVTQCVFEYFLQQKYRIQQHNLNNWKFEFNGKELIFPNNFFPYNGKNLIDKSILPKQPLKWLTVEDKKIPILFGSREANTFSDVDIMGSIFFMLSRLEEYINPNRDQYKRFPSSESLAYKEGFLLQPIVDEYTDILEKLFKKTFTGYFPVKKHYVFELSHDVDVPTRWVNKGAYWLCRGIAAAILKHRSVRKLKNTIYSYRDINLDKQFCFTWIMDESEKRNIKSQFNFMSMARTKYDLSYNIKSTAFQNLMNEIINRGHLIGFHPSFSSFDNENIFMEELALLKQSSPSPIISGRQHYLRLEIPKTWSFWEKAELKEDASLGFADHIGYRAGTAKSYPAFDVLNSRKMNLNIHPLICMEHTMLHPDYMNLSYQEAYEKITKVIDDIKASGGRFSLLWHNHNLVEEKDRELYRKILDYAV